MTTTTTTTCFTADNTEGYSAADLAILNARFAEVCAAEGVDLDDPDSNRDYEDHLAERVLVEFDSQQDNGPATASGSIVSAYLDAHAADIDDQSAAAISQVTDEQWPAVLAALAFHSDGAIDRDVAFAVTRETLADFDSARDNHWSERGRRTEHRIDGLDALRFERFQLVRGTARRDMTVLDLGTARLSLC